MCLFVGQQKPLEIEWKAKPKTNVRQINDEYCENGKNVEEKGARRKVFVAFVFCIERGERPRKVREFLKVA